MIDRGIPFAQVYLKNGDRFNYLHGHVAGFYAHDAFFKFPDAGRVEDFLGRKKMGTNDAIALVKEVVKKLGYSGKPLNISFYAPAYSWSDKFTRYFVHFERPDDHSDIAVFEIDLESKVIKSIYIDNPSLWRESPKIDAPLSDDPNPDSAQQDSVLRK